MNTLINPGTTPQVYTEEGHTLAAGERLEDVTLDEVGQGAVDAGLLLVLEEKKSARKSSTKNKSASDDMDADSTASPARRSGDTPS